MYRSCVIGLYALRGYPITPPPAAPPKTKYASFVWAAPNVVPTIGIPFAALTIVPSGWTLMLFAPPYCCFSRSAGKLHAASPAAVQSMGHTHPAAPVGI